jgi:hypothetical protein
MILGAAVVCSGCGIYHSGRVSVPVAQAGGTVAERIPSIRFELQEAVVTVEAGNYRRERERLSYAHWPTIPTHHPLRRTRLSSPRFRLVSPAFGEMHVQWTGTLSGGVRLVRGR